MASVTPARHCADGEPPGENNTSPQVEGVKTSLQSLEIELLSLQPYLSPQFQVTAATKNRGEQNAN